MKVYLDNSATSFPKPPGVLRAMSAYIGTYGASPGRSAHALAVKAAREVFETRELLSAFFNNGSSERVIFSANATLALNIAIKGILKPGDHAIISSMEHNSVHRPLRYLERNGMIELSRANCNNEGYLDLDDLKNLFRPNTKLVAIIHGSNVAGTVQPVRDIGNICKQHGAIFLVDAAQTAGFIPIDMQLDRIDVLAFTGHKKLYGPPGIGGICINKNIHIDAFIHGGSGSISDSDSHPDFYPDRLEAGTPNTMGIIGLKAGLEYVMKKGLENIRNIQSGLTKVLINELKNLDHVRIYGPETAEFRLPLVAVNLERIPPSTLSEILDRQYGIMTRSGLHCSPLAHKAIGSFPLGATRLSLGAFNTETEIRYTVNAMKKILTSNNLK